MNPLTLEWVEKAEGDFNTASRELRARQSPNYDAVCFHSQQAAEKYLKALLQESHQNIPRTHQLMDLFSLCQKTGYSINMLVPDLMALDGMGVKFRYPGEKAEKADANPVKHPLLTGYNLTYSVL